MSVDLPEPDGPIIATYSPRSMEIDTPFSAWISSSPITEVRQRSRVSIRDIPKVYGTGGPLVPRVRYGPPGPRRSRPFTKSVKLTGTRDGLKHTLSSHA